MMRAAVWRKSSLSAKSSLRLLPQPRPLLTSMDFRPVQGGEPATKGGGRRGLRGGETALSPVLTPCQQKTTMTISSPVPASPSPMLPPPHLHKRSHPSRHLRHRSCRHQGSRRLAKLRASAVVLRFWPKKRQIPQIDGCCSPPSPPLPPSPSTPACNRVRGRATPAVGDIIFTPSAAGASAATGLVAA
jgi:hypothetical protein